MAIQTTKPIVNRFTQLELPGCYIRLEITDKPCGSGYNVELYHYEDKASFNRGAGTIKVNEVISILSDVELTRSQIHDAVITKLIEPEYGYAAVELTKVDLT